jgi:hypothetical protein
MTAVQWKLLNIQKLIKQNPDKHAKQLKALEDRHKRTADVHSLAPKAVSFSLLANFAMDAILSGKTTTKEVAPWRP